MGKPGFPIPLRKGCALPFPRAGVGRNLVPHPPAGGPGPPVGGGVGEPGFPTLLARGLCSRETVMRMAHHAAMTMTWERGRDARATAPRARRRPPP